MARILLVEDEFLIAMSAEGMLDEEGHEVTHAVDGQQALDFIKNEIPDLVITDYMMPRLDGAGLIRAIREEMQLSELRIIMMSAVPAEKIASMNLAIDAFLQKPFSNAQLTAVVARVIEEQ